MKRTEQLEKRNKQLSRLCNGQAKCIAMNALNSGEVKAQAHMDKGESTGKDKAVSPSARATAISKGKGKTAKAKAPRKPSAGVNLYGVRIGTDAETLTNMAEKGKFTMSQIVEKTGGKTRYNLLRDLTARGHKVTIDPETHIITLKPGKATKKAA